MPGNPFTAERRERLQADVTEFLADFSKTYGAMFGVTTLEKIEKDLEEKKKDPRKLSYRKWNSVPRGELFKGQCYVKTGAGSGGFKKWKKVYLVERKDYNIDVYGSEEEYGKKKKAKYTIRCAGYQVVRDVAKHLHDELHELAGGLGLNDEAVNNLTMFSPYSWGLAHPWRPNYIFQLHQSSAKEPTCGCIGGGSVVEPADAGKAEAKDRDKFIKFMERCASKSCPRDLKSVSGKAFEKSVGKMCDIHHRLYNFRDDGTESEILVDMLLEQCFSPMRDDILNDLVGPVKIRIAAWYKIRGVLQTTVLGICDPAWTKMQDGVNTLMAKVEEKVSKGAKPIVDLKNEVKNKVKDAIKSNTSDKLATLVEPHVGPILKGLENPLKEAFAKQREVYVKEVPQISTLPDDKTQRNAKLDAIPRTRSIVQDIVRATDHLIKPLLNLKKINVEIFGNLDPHKYREVIHSTVVKQTLDAAMNTLEKEMDKDGKKDSLKDDVLEDFDRDCVLARRKFLQVVITDLLLGNVKRALSVVTQPILDGMNSVIPEDMQEFMDINALYDDTVDLIVGGTIEKVVNETIPLD